MDAKHILSRYGYRLGYTLGEGTYSKVKFATSEQHQRDVAIKVIDRRKLPPDFEEKFLPREVDLLRSLHHQNIVEVLQLIEGCRGYIFFVMELAQSDLLRLMQERGSLDQRTARGIFTELCSAVHYLHQMHVAHRDVKCENVLLVDGLHVRLTDFGFARQFQMDLAHPGCLEELSKTYCGSAAYTSPEVLLGTPYDPRLLDLWSLGVVLFIMVTGYMPFDDSNLMQLVRQQKKGVTFSGVATPGPSSHAQPLPGPSGTDDGGGGGTADDSGHDDFMAGNVPSGSGSSSSPRRDGAGSSNATVDTRCEDLILKLLSFKPLARPQLAQVFLHPWMMEAPDQDLMLIR
ncbi:testis-specific serine/threonine-protein kinase 6-like isoform X3 [Lethenteron reissneri]|uniref:testis-specific serine/threonine-protein kinase 6-like isoform X3 n=1 Tax=Lethenteron reissneri TaxID=7753 RepID=UPI002AB69787|nr:testis-specific serine/threonine-protein kinase 6-like isoform X3 [Lethenteron reissneri]